MHAGSSGPEIAFQVDPTRLDQARKRERIRGGAMLIAGILGILLGSFFVLMAIVVFSFGVESFMGVIIVGVIGGLAPTVGAIVLTWRGIVRLSIASKLDELAGLAHNRAAVTVAQVIQWTGCTPDAATKLLLVAFERGAVRPLAAR